MNIKPEEDALRLVQKHDALTYSIATILDGSGGDVSVLDAVFVLANVLAQMMTAGSLSVPGQPVDFEKTMEYFNEITRMQYDRSLKMNEFAQSLAKADEGQTIN